MKRTKFIFLLSITCLLLSCGRSSIDRQLDDIESYIRERPDSALSAIRSIDRTLLSSAESRAHFSLLHAMALDKNYIDTTDLSVIQPAIDYYREHGSLDHRAQAYYYLGCIQQNSHKDVESVQTLTYALDIAAEASNDYYLGLIYNALYFVYAKSYNAQESLNMARKAYDYDVKSGNLLGAWIYKGKIASSYYGLKKYEIADSLFKEFISLPILDTAAYARTLLDYSRHLVLKKPDSEPEKSIAVFNDAVRKFKAEPQLSDYYVYAFALEKQKKSAVVDKLLAQLKKRDSTDIAYFAWNYKIHKLRGEYDPALHFLEQSIKMQDSIIISNLRQSLQTAQRDYYKEKAAGEEMQHDIDKLKFSIIILLLAVIIGIFSFVIYRKNKEKKNRILELSFLKAYMEGQLRDMETKNTEKDKKIAALLQDYYNLFKNQYVRLNELCEAYFSPAHKEPKDKIYDCVKEILEEISDARRSPSRAEDLVNSNLDNIIQRARKEMPLLSEQDFRLISLVILGLSAKTISTIMGISPTNVYTRKSRIKSAVAQSDIPSKNELLHLLG